jgi:glucan phosphoethanolaminetransferase (alkaline phosphatase superfamily)
MIVSIPLIAILAIVAWIAYRHMGLRLWHALVCIILGFLLAATGAAPDMNQVIATITHWFGGGR